MGPIIAGVADAELVDAGLAGIPSPWVSSYIPVAPGQYDARVVVAGAGSCAAGIGLDATMLLPALRVGQAQTLALIGEVAPPPGGLKMRVSVFPDDLVAPSGSNTIRIINAVSGMPQIDVGTGSLAANTFLAIFQRVPVGATGQPSGAWIPFLVDANGYDPNAAISNASLSAHATGAIVDAVSSIPPLISIGTGAVVTIAVVGEANADVSLIECVDNAGTLGTLGSCNVAHGVSP
jgi:hypothetical protein